MRIHVDPVQGGARGEVPDGEVGPVGDRDEQGPCHHADAQHQYKRTEPAEAASRGAPVVSAPRGEVEDARSAQGHSHRVAFRTPTPRSPAGGRSGRSRTAPRTPALPAVGDRLETLQRARFRIHPRVGGVDVPRGDARLARACAYWSSPTSCAEADVCASSAPASALKSVVGDSPRSPDHRNRPAATVSAAAKAATATGDHDVANRAATRTPPTPLRRRAARRRATTTPRGAARAGG